MKGRRLGTSEAMADMLAARVMPTSPYPGTTNAPWPGICMDCGQEVAPWLMSIRKGRGGCIHCTSRMRRIDPTATLKEAGVARKAARKALYAKRATKALRDAGREPLTPYPGYNKPWASRCTGCGLEAVLRLHYIKDGFTPCTCQVRHPRHPRNNVYHPLRIDEEQAVAEMVAGGARPITPFPGGKKPWLSVCMTCGMKITPRLGGIRHGQGACIYCAPNTPFTHETAAAVMRNGGWVPVAKFRTAKAPWESVCITCGLTSTPSLNNVKNNGSGCGTCAERGFQRHKPSQVYLVVHHGMAAAKVGVCGVGTSRLREYIVDSWEVAHVMNVPGPLALEVERGVLVWWRKDLGLPPHLSKKEMPKRGWTETVGLDEIDIPTTIRRMCDLASRASAA